MIPRIRKGNDFKHIWPITWNGQPEDFSDATDITLTAKVYGQVKTLTEGVDYHIDGGTVVVDFTPAICDIPGTYTIELNYIKPSAEFVDGDRRSAVDVQAFQIVNTSAEANATEGVSLPSEAMAAYALKYDDLTEAQKDELRGKGITSIDLTGEVGDTKTYTITYADGLTFDFSVTDGHTPIFEFVGTVLHIDGVAGPDLKGETGNGIASVELTSTVGLVKTYTITFTDATTTTFTVTDGATAVVQEKGSNTSVVMSQKAVTDELDQLAGEVSQAVKKTDSKIYIGAVQTELDWMYNGAASSVRNVAVLSDGRFICNFASKLTTYNDVMGISWQRADINPTSIPYEMGGYIYVSDATQLYKLTLEGIDVKTYPIANINSVAVAPNGNIVVGRTGAVGKKTVIYMNNDGLELWSNTEVGNCAAVDIDGNGNVLAGHHINQAGDGLRIYNSVGVKQKQSGRAYIVDAKFDKEDNVVLLAAVTSAGLYKYDKSLNQLWSRSEVTSSDSARSKLSIGDDNTIYAPLFSTAVGPIDCYRFTEDGYLIYKFASGGAARATSFVPDNNGYVYLCNNLQTTNTLSRYKEYNKVRIW